jgi:glycosyltransferase 2 family protein
MMQNNAAQLNDKRGRLSRWSLAVSCVIAAILLFLSFRGVAWQDMLVTLRRARIDYLLISFATLSLSYMLRAWRWNVLLRAEANVSVLKTFWATMVGYLGNSFLPARAGEIIRSVMIGRQANLSTSYVLATALTERLIDVIALVFISLIALMSLPSVPGWLHTAVRVMAVAGAVGGIGLFIAPRIEGLLKRTLARLPLPGHLAERLTGLLEQFLLGMRALHRPGRLFGFIGLTIVIWLIDGVMAIWIAQALDLSLAFPHALLLLAALGLASAAPSTPGYVGIYQFVAVTVLAPFGFAQSQALVYIIAFQAISYAVIILWGLLGAWLLGLRGGLRSKALAELP